MNCPKCKAEMIEGFVADRSYASVFVSQWVEGKPERSTWEVTKVKDKEQIEIVTYRCSGCGYLESYAN